VNRSSAWLLLLLLPFTGCQCAPTGTKGAIVYGRGFDANTLDPINTDVGEAVSVIVNVYDTLVTYDEKTTELVPSLATSLGEVSDDGLTWTFPLREDVAFHDGTPFNAEAVQFTFARLLEEEHPQVYDDARPYRPAFVQMIEEVQAPEPHTVIFKLKEPSAIFLQNLAMFPASIVSPTAVKKHGADFAVNPVGTGPFQFNRWEREQRIVLSAYESHWRGKPAAEHVIFLPVRESATRIQKIEAGSIHIADNLPPSALDELAKNPQIVVQQQPGMNVGYLATQTEKPGLKNANIRRAIAHAIDKAELVRIAYGGHAAPAVNIVPQSMEFWHNSNIDDRAFDLEQAKALLEQGIQEEGLSLPLEFTLAIMDGPRPYMQQPLEVASFIKDSLAKIDINVTIEPRAANQHFDYMMAGNHELGLAGWSSDNNDPDNFLYNLLDLDNISQHGNNLSRYRNQELHKILIAAQTELDRDARREMYQRAQQLIFDDAPVIPLIHTTVRIALRDEVQGYQLHPTSMVRLRTAHVPEQPAP